MKAQWEMKLCRKVHPIKILIRVGRWQHEVARRASPVQVAKLARAAEPLFAGTGLNEPRFCGQGILQKFETIVQNKDVQVACAALIFARNFSTSRSSNCVALGLHVTVTRSKRVNKMHERPLPLSTACDQKWSGVCKAELTTSSPHNHTHSSLSRLQSSQTRMDEHKSPTTWQIN